MKGLLLEKSKLGSDWIDASVGEAYIVKDILFKIFSPLSFDYSNDLFEYPSPEGYEPLVKLLEAKYNAPVIITNGAKGALAACFYALNKIGKETIGMMCPYWALLPPLVKIQGLIPIFDPLEYVDAYLAVAPNNPCAYMNNLDFYSEQANKNTTVLIHDAVYYTHTYIPPSIQLKVYGDAQIYSASKSFGLSGLRIGWVVCRNEKMYYHIKEYMETMTVGVSMLSQSFLLYLLMKMYSRPDLTKQFETETRAVLTDAKRAMLKIDPDVLVVPSNIADTNGMFLWCKVGPKADFNKAKVNVIDGVHFGKPGYIRMNLAFDIKTINEIVKRLNNSVKD